MSPSSTPATKSHGQWINDREPLNANEVMKAEDDGLNVRARVEEIYAKEGFDSIPDSDLRGRLRWWGLYTQRKPGIPGGKTGILEPHELDDSLFMLRVRSDGGALSVEQARVIGTISTEFAQGTADISDRQNIQLHHIRIEDMPEIWKRLEAVGLGTTEACGDTPRVILGSPLAGVDEAEIIDGTPAITEIVKRYVGDPAFSNLPRKFKSAVSGSPWLDVVHEVNDLSFIGVVHPEHGPGFDVWVGGGLSTNPRLAERLGAWVPLDEVPEVWAGVISIFRDYGYRRLRTKARLKFLLADWGAAKFREVLETEYLKRKLIDGPAPVEPAGGRRDHVGVHTQKDGRVYVGATPTVGRIGGDHLTALAQLTESFGSDRIRLTAHQKVVVLDIPKERAAEFVIALRDIGLEAEPSTFRRSAMACTGIEFCKLAIVETKAVAAAAVTELEKRLPNFREPLALHVNGCPNSCARFQIADIGLKGALVTDDDGNQIEGFQVHLGGSLGGLDDDTSDFGRKPRGLRVTAEELPDLVERLVTTFELQRTAGESFAQWAVRADEDALR
jgi:sulfite reductase (ferredoxin)